MTPPPVRRIAILGNHTPRRCGIATFTADLAKSLIDSSTQVAVDVFAISDRPNYDYRYPVKSSIDANDLEAYRKLADYLNEEQYDVLCVQHEFGIFGGEAGSHVLELLRNVKMPIVTTLHTILQKPSESQRRVFEELTQLSERVVCMSKKGVSILTETYGVPAGRIEEIPHGIREVDFELGEKLRDEHGIRHNALILTFGLLSQDKGIHNMIEAMGSIVKRHPDATYVVLGATHPNVVEHEGETYRESLQDKAKNLKIEKNIIFIDRFVSDGELAGWLGAADIYVTPYLKPEQITSGTLAYALGGGNAVVSTPYWHAEELLQKGRGVLVPFNDPAALSNAISGLITNPKLRLEICARAADHGKSMTWPQVGIQYLRTFEKAKMEGADRLRSMSTDTKRVSEATRIPYPSLEHIFALTDDTGIFQHAKHRFPNRHEGYCTDDNVRALTLATMARAVMPSKQISRLQDTYFGFVLHAFNEESGRFHNFMDYSRNWLDVGSDDCQGRVARALGYQCLASDEDEIQSLSCEYFKKAVDSILLCSSPRAWASAILGCGFSMRSGNTFSSIDSMRFLANRLYRLYVTASSHDWPWFERSATYENALLPHAMLVAGDAMDSEILVEVGLNSLKWLMEQQTSEEGFFAPIGCHGFYVEGGKRAWHDQQPIDASASVSACLTAARVTGDTAWAEEAFRAFRWFTGSNTERVSMINESTGRCYDGLMFGEVNRNSGAESTLAFLTACFELMEFNSASHTKPAFYLEE